MALYFYYAPKIKNVSVTRHGALGIPSPNGAFLRITATREFCPFYQTSPGTAEVISNKCEIRYRYRMLPDGAYSAWTTILASSVTHTNEVTTDVMNVGLVSGKSYEVIVGVKDDVGEANTSIVLTAGDVFMHRDGEKNSIGIGEAVAEENTVSIAAKMALKVKGLLSVAKEVLVGSGKFSSTSVDMHEEGYFGNFYMSLPQNAEYPATAYLSHPYGGQLIANCGAGRVALTGLTEPVDASDATNKDYVDTNFAPVGFGLGGKTDEPKTDDLNDAVACGWYAFTTDTLNRPFNYGTVMVTNRYGNQITQLAFNPYMDGNGEMCVRHYYDGWKEWEYINPPMKTGVEYRTTERWKGKVVYTKLVSFTMPNNQNTNVPGLSPSMTVVDYDVVMVAPGLSMKLPYFDANGVMQARAVCNANSSVIQVLTKSDLSSYTGHATIKYTKD